MAAHWSECEVPTCRKFFWNPGHDRMCSQQCGRVMNHLERSDARMAMSRACARELDRTDMFDRERLEDLYGLPAS